MNRTWITLAGWAAITSALAYGTERLISVFVLVERQNMDTALISFDLFRTLLIFPCLIALSLALRPFEGRRVLWGLAVGMIIGLFVIAVSVLLLTHILTSARSNFALVLVSTVADLLSGCWILWLFWASMRRGILTGGLPWFGMAAGIGSLAYAFFFLSVSLANLRLLRTISIYGEWVTLAATSMAGLVWRGWLGALLISNRIVV